MDLMMTGVPQKYPAIFMQTILIIEFVENKEAR